MPAANRSLGALLISLLVCVGVFAACADTPEPDERAPDIRGTITQISAPGATEVPFRMLVEGRIEEDTRYDRASVSVVESTRVFQETEDGFREASRRDLATGQRVEVQFREPVAESYPVQAQAGQVVILR